MSTQGIVDFLTKQLFVDKNVITYRSLSREFAIHVNAAKNELEAYLQQAQPENVPAATYLITGEEEPRNSCRVDEDSRMAVDEDNEGGESQDVDMDADEDVQEVQVLLVSESELEGAKSQFRRIYSIHIYSLSPAPIRDAKLLCGPTDRVRQIDNSQKGVEMSTIVGKVISKQIQAKVVIPDVHSAFASRLKPSASATSSSSKSHKQDTPKEREQDKPSVKGIVAKPKATGKLDFSKAKIKEVKKEDTKESIGTKTAQNGVKAEVGSSKVKVEKTADDEREKEVPKRGVKRKSGGVPASDTESDADVTSKKGKSEIQKSDKELREARPKKNLKSTSSLLSDDDDDDDSVIQPETKKAPKLKKKVVLSDDDDELPASRRRIIRKESDAERSRYDDNLLPSRRKTMRKESQAEQSLREMMDIDDDKVTRASRSGPIEPEEEPTETGNEDEDVEMTDNIDITPAAKTRKKRVKKVIPVGRNGLKKRRVMKSRTRVDDKGYMVTEDYSSYESVDEEEPEPEKPKGKKKSTAGKVADGGSSATSNYNKPALKKSAPAAKPTARNGAKSTKSTGGSKLVHKGSIANFFGPVKNK